jgi:hypothetical protein
LLGTVEVVDVIELLLSHVLLVKELILVFTASFTPHFLGTLSERSSLSKLSGAVCGAGGTYRGIVLHVQKPSLILLFLAPPFFVLDHRQLVTLAQRP